MTLEARELVERLREACNGHPHVKIAWPHRVLHDAATTITTLLDKLAAAEQGKRVCVARVETLTTCGLAEVALSNPAVMRQWGELTARAEAAERERDEAITGSNALLASQNEIVHKITARAESAEARADKLAAALEPFAGDKLPGNNRDHIEYDRFGLRRLMSDMEIARRNAFFALHPEQHPLARSKGVANG